MNINNPEEGHNYIDIKKVGDFIFQDISIVIVRTLLNLCLITATKFVEPTWLVTN